MLEALALFALVSTAEAAFWPFGSSNSTASSTPVKPRPKPVLPEYDGKTIKVGPVMYRPDLLRYEPYIIAAVLAYVILGVVGSQMNKREAKRVFSTAVAPVLREQFSRIGVDVDQEIAQDTGNTFLSYASGRRGLISLNVELATKNRQDILLRAYLAARHVFDYTFDDGTDKLVLRFNMLPPKAQPGSKFVFAVLDKREMRKIRNSRWDLRTFTNPNESSAMPSTLAIMSESGDVTDSLLKLPAAKDVGMREAFAGDAPGLKYFESLVISDMPADTPDEYDPKLPEHQWALTLTLRLPPSSEAETVKSFVELACNLVDVLYLRQRALPDVAIQKFKKRRADILHELTAEKRREEKEAAEEEARKRKKAEEDMKLAGMSKDERRKFEEKQRAKALKRSQKARTKVSK